LRPRTWGCTSSSTRPRETAAAAVSGNNNTGALLGGAAFAAGRFNNALSLDGIDGRVLINNTAGLNLANALTLSAWLNPADLSGAYRTVAIKGVPGLRGYGMNVKAGALNFVKMAATDTNVTSTVTLATGAWQHAVITWDATAGEVKFYLNGVLAQTVLDAAALTAPLDADYLSIGSWLTGGSFFKGSIDDLRIYNRALSAADVSTLHHNAPP